MRVYVFKKSSDGTFYQEDELKLTYNENVSAGLWSGVTGGHVNFGYRVYVSPTDDIYTFQPHETTFNDYDGALHRFQRREQSVSLPPQLQWHLAESSSDDCDVVCAAHGKVCDVDALQFDYVVLSGNYVDLFAAASSAGISCNNGGGVGGTSAPIYHNGNCYQSNSPSNQVCSGSVGFGLRICPCV